MYVNTLKVGGLIGIAVAIAYPSVIPFALTSIGAVYVSKSAYRGYSRHAESYNNGDEAPEGLIPELFSCFFELKDGTYRDADPRSPELIEEYEEQALQDNRGYLQRLNEMLFGAEKVAESEPMDEDEITQLLADARQPLVVENEEGAHHLDAIFTTNAALRRNMRNC